MKMGHSNFHIISKFTRLVCVLFYYFLIDDYQYVHFYFILLSQNVWLVTSVSMPSEMPLDASESMLALEQ